jgi:hypothetical protein
MAIEGEIQLVRGGCGRASISEGPWQCFDHGGGFIGEAKRHQEWLSQRSGQNKMRLRARKLVFFSEKISLIVHF